MRIFFLGLLALIAVALIALAVSFYAYLHPLPYNQQTIVIPPHTGAQATLGLLHDAGLTPPLPYIAIPVVMSGVNKQLKAGEYEFEAGLSPSQILMKIARGDIVVHKVTIPEGWNSFQVRDVLNAEPLLTGQAISAIAEGSVLPDTYRFTRNEPRADVLTRMQHARDEALTNLWNARDPQISLTTPEQALILASIVERETGVADERAKVAGVFFNRLKLNMPLQTDPTVAYGIILAHRGAAMDRPLSGADLKTDTIYNSYTRTGLPPTPICNPGREAIAATLHPAATDALYFVATGHGGHHFAATLEEHLKNVEIYRKSQHP